MPFNPTTGKWEDEDASVQTRMTGLLGSDSDYMRQAEAQGTAAANKRGLLNSTMGVRAAQAARIGAALPIASQDAAQLHARNTQERGITSTEGMQRAGFQHESGLQGADIAARERMLGSEQQHARELQGADLASQQAMQERDLGSRTQLQSGELASRERMQGADIASQQWMASLDNQTRQVMQGLDLESQQRIASMNVASADRESAARLAATLESNYNSMIESLMNNPDIPADVRQTYMDHAMRIRLSNIGLVEQFYAVDLQWEAA